MCWDPVWGMGMRVGWGGVFTVIRHYFFAHHTLCSTPTPWQVPGILNFIVS